MTAVGKVYLLGAGPGDPELITLRARRRLAEADVVLYDALVHPDLLEYCRPDAELVFVGKRGGRASERQTDINRRMIEAANAGRIVARLKGGDPYLFGRGSEEAENLAAAGIAFEVVPGVPSPMAATAYAGISLTHRELASSIAYVTATESELKDQSAHDWGKLATATQTLVIFMGARKLESLMQLLIANGRAPTCPAAVIQSASLPEQRTVIGTVADIAERAREANIGMPALTVVGDVIGLREQLRWYDRKPLFGKRVLVTRAAEQAGAMTQALRDAGAAAVLAPAIRFEPPEDREPLRRALRELGQYGWVVFTSVNGVQAFFGELHALGGDARKLGSARVAAIGTATAARLRAYGVEPDVVPALYRGEAVADAIAALHADSDTAPALTPSGIAERVRGGASMNMRGVAVLLARAAVARDALPERLRQAGARVDIVAAYQTLPPSEEARAKLRAAIQGGSVDIVAFSSTSTVDNTVSMLGPDAKHLLERLTIASIGPITSEAAERHGLRVDVTASEYTIPGLVAALERYVGQAG